MNTYPTVAQLNDAQRQHLAWRLDHKTACGMLTALHIARGNWGDKTLPQIFEEAGNCTPHSAKIHARKVMNFSL